MSFITHPCVGNSDPSVTHVGACWERTSPGAASVLFPSRVPFTYPPQKYIISMLERLTKLWVGQIEEPAVHGRVTDRGPRLGALWAPWGAHLPPGAAGEDPPTLLNYRGHHLT
ncbi:hypothetical protein J6590_001083 [Homalodisca vitripennis]|nr:hypothetical protein J6590_001083 [Homalodisca vitripennis]